MTGLGLERTVHLLLLFVFLAQCMNERVVNTRERYVIDRKNRRENNGSTLFLTPYIMAGKLEKGRRLAAVKKFKYESYTGFLTVNRRYNRNLFFWFFPALENRQNAPVLVWLQGGPGATSLFGLFEGNGPFRVTKSAKLRYNPYTWIKTHSIVYIDSPVGSGFSFTKDGRYRKSTSEAAVDLYKALIQFFMLFPEYASRQFFITGESYAGKYVPALARKIHVENRRSPKVKINLKGLAMGNAYTDPIHLEKYSTLLYSIGLIDEKERKHFEQKEKATNMAIRKRLWIKGFKIMDNLIMNFFVDPTYFTNVTGYTYYYNFLESVMPPYQTYFEKFVAKSSVRRAIHVGSKRFHGLMNNEVLYHLREDYLKSGINWVIKLLDAPEEYKILFYSGNLDICVPIIGTEEMLQKMRWSGSRSYSNARKKQWIVANELAGYIRQAKNLAFLVIRNSGHIVPHDQPKFSLDMINRFTGGKKFA